MAATCTIIFLMVTIAVPVQAFYPHADDDSTWYDKLPNPDTIDWRSSLFKHYSSGWFPQPYSARMTAVLFTTNIYEWDRTSSFRSSSFHPTRASFSSSDPFDGNQTSIKKPNSSDDADDEFPGGGFGSIGALYAINVPALGVLRGAITYDRSRTRLYSVDTSRSFLALNGSPQAFREVNVLFLNQHFLTGHLGLQIPVYGIFFETEAATISSYYYVYAGVQVGGRTVSEATQYVQIADAKDRIRYANGQDTVTVMNKALLPTSNLLRTYADVAIGWRAGFRGIFSFFIEAYSSLPINTVLSDADWKQYRFGIRTVIGFEREDK